MRVKSLSDLDLGKVKSYFPSWDSKKSTRSFSKPPVKQYFFIKKKERKKDKILDKIQRVINCSARLIYKASKSAHITPLLFDLHWLPISNRIQYKTALTCFHIITGTAPPYLSEFLHLYSPSRSLRSASDTRTVSYTHLTLPTRRTV